MKPQLLQQEQVTIIIDGIWYQLVDGHFSEDEDSNLEECNLCALRSICKPNTEYNLLDLCAHPKALGDYFFINATDLVINNARRFIQQIPSGKKAVQ